MIRGENDEADDRREAEPNHNSGPDLDTNRVMVRFGFVELDEQEEGTARDERHDPRRDRFAERLPAARLFVPSGVSSRSAIYESYPIHPTHSGRRLGGCGIRPPETRW